MSKLSRRDLFRFQAHALLDGIDRCPGGIPLRDDFDGHLTRLPCPVCLEWTAFGDLCEDHAPPRARQSTLGPPQVVVMTCQACNRGAGETYEADVSREINLLYTVPAPYCPVHSTTALRGDGQVVPRNMEARTTANLKAAFLVGMATLGYRWAAAPRLASIREVLRGERHLTLASNDFDLTCLEETGLVPFSVYEVERPVPCILVVGVHAGVVLPCATSPWQVAGRLVHDTGKGMVGIAGDVRRRPWPPDYTTSRTVEQVWDAMHLFHYDRCTTETHETFAIDRHELARIVGVP